MASQEMRTLEARCLCKAVHFTVALPTSSFPLPVHLCHCTICRYTHGTLCIFHAELPAGVAPRFVAPSSLDNLTSYCHASSKSERFFCSTCGCHIGDRGLGREYGTGWVIATSLFPDHTEDTFQIKRHCFTEASPGDGLHSFLPSIAGREIEVWNPDPEDPTWDAKPAAPPPETEYDAQGNERLRGQCHCGGVSFTVPRPTVPAVQNDPYLRRWASPLDPNKWIACLDVCDDCRLVDGTHVIAWTFLPAALLDPPLKPDLSCFGTLKVYNSSEGVRRGFCGTCGATVVFAWDGRIPTDQQAIVDIAIGVLRAPEGVLAEKWLTWRSGRLAWPSSGERYDPEFTKALKEGLAAWGMKKHGVAHDFKID